MQHDGREQVDRARAAMAERARLPWWMVAVQAIAMLALLLQPVLSHAFPHARGWALLGWPIAIVLLFGPMLLRRTRGADIGRRPLAGYPSTRALGITVIAVALVGVLVENLLVRDHRLVLAAVVAVVLAAGLAVYQVRENTLVRRDIRDGRAVSR